MTRRARWIVYSITLLVLLVRQGVAVDNGYSGPEGFPSPLVRLTVNAIPGISYPLPAYAEASWDATQYTVALQVGHFAPRSGNYADIRLAVTQMDCGGQLTTTYTPVGQTGFGGYKVEVQAIAEDAQGITVLLGWYDRATQYAWTTRTFALPIAWYNRPPGETVHTFALLADVPEPARRFSATLWAAFTLADPYLTQGAWTAPVAGYTRVGNPGSFTVYNFLTE